MDIPINKKIYFSSDNHLGAPSLEESHAREKIFVSWLDSIKDDADIIFLLGFGLITLNSCGPGGDARKNPPDPAERVKKNLEEGRGFRIMDFNKNNQLFVEIVKSINRL